MFPVMRSRGPSVSRMVNCISLCPPPAWLAHQESQEEGQGGHFKVHDSIPGPQPKNVGSVQPCKQQVCILNQILTGSGHMFFFNVSL